MTKDQEIGKKILQQIFRNGSVTRPEIVKMTGARAATVFYAMDQLKEQRLVCEPERPGKKTGRKAPELFFSPDHMYLAGVHFQSTKTLAVLTDMNGTILFQQETPAGERKTLAACRSEISAALQQLKKQAGPCWGKLRGIGFADPGLVNIPEGISMRAVNVPGWENSATGAWLTGESGAASGVWPECMVKTFMEYRLRRFSPQTSIFLLSMDNGIGGGFMKDGKFFTGDTHQAMEIGHIVIDPDGPLCRCGNRGCLEAVAGEAEIRRRVQNALQHKVETVLRAEDFSFGKLAEYARSDKAARIIAADVCENIGKALAVAVTLLNPSVIVLSGHLTSLGELLTDSIRNMLNRNCFPGAVRDLKLELSTLRAEDTAKGAALMMCGKLLELF